MSFIDYFALITDPRKDITVKHDLWDVIFLTITGVVSGVDDTIARIISALVPEEFTKMD